MASLKRRIVAELWHGTLIDPFVVPTPNPYFVEGDTDQKEKLLAEAQTLWHVLSMLGISAIDAREQDYSLNEYTYDTLFDMAMDRGRYDVTTILETYGWSHKSKGYRMFRPQRIRS